MSESSVFTPSDFPEPNLVAVNDIVLEVFEAGREHAGNPIVLCHGWPEHAFSWRHQMTALADAGHHVIVPNQRGFGQSSRPTEVTDYDIAHLTGDLVGLLDHFGYDDATFIGHDWGANVVWNMALLHPDRVTRLAALALPYQARGDTPWIEWMEAVFGDDFYFVHFNRQPGVADAVLDANTHQFLRNLYRRDLPPPTAPAPGNMMSNLALATAPAGEPVMSEEELKVFVSAFEASGFSGGINWYRNLDRNWHLLADVDPVIPHQALMIYGAKDMIQQEERLPELVPNVEIVTLDTGHWIQQEQPRETSDTILRWLRQQEGA